MKTDKPKTVLVADDDNDDCMLAKEALGECAAHVQVHCVEDGAALMEYLFNSRHLPSLILLDLNMPKKDGRQALKEIKSTSTLRQIPVVVFTTSREQKDITYSTQTGAESFITKPSDFSAWINIMNELAANYLGSGSDHTA